jgi:hypothetical protein
VQVDDYYLNLLHWGANNTLAVGLGNSVYLWHPDTAKVEQLVQLEDENDMITSVCWSQIHVCWWWRIVIVLVCVVLALYARCRLVSTQFFC